MIRLQRLCAATTLLLVLSVSTLAGTIHTNAVDPPPPPAPATQPDELKTDGYQSPIETETLLNEITLSLLQLLLAI